MQACDRVSKCPKCPLQNVQNVLCHVTQKHDQVTTMDHTFSYCSKNTHFMRPSKG